MNKSKITKIVISVCAAATIVTTAAFAGCTGKDTSTETDNRYIVTVEKTSTVGLVDTYTITYSDDSTYQFTITNGSDGDDLDIDEIYAKYKENYPDATYEDFLKAVIATSADEEFTVSNKALRSSLKVYSEFTESYQYVSGNGFHQQIKTAYETAIYCGSAVIYSIDSSDGGYTYMITNYHVLYDSSEAKDSTKLAKKITCYLYGSEGEPTKTSSTDTDGCTVYDYGDYAIECDYVGGSITADLAVIKAKTEDVMAINDGIVAVEFADEYHVGQSAIAIGNAENEGISVTSGVVSVDNELISYSIDGTTRSYRSMRIDTAIYGGNSGGGLFDSDGKLIGITNAGDSSDQNINYAIPVNIVKPVVESIIRYSDGTVKAADLGLTVTSANSKYVYDSDKGYGQITEDVVVKSVTSSSVADAMGIAEGDKLISITINDEEYELNRYFDLSDILYTLKEDDYIQFTYKDSSGTENKSTKVQLKSSDIVTVA